jgi:Na+/H+ antiporter NhaD/arsenite permease-like protein
LEAGILSIVPFILLLLSIAVTPFISSDWWDRNYYVVSIVLASVILVYYIITGKTADILISTEDYIKFISLLASLYIISGGIFIRIKGTSTPLRNVMFLFTGAVLANIIGTTGASMLLIRPFINTNRIRITHFHIIFFIFIVSNIGGALTPIGDPPLLLGYIKGIPFFWIIGKVFFKWFFALVLVILIFYFFDRANYKKQPVELQKKEVETPERIEVKGLYNLLFLVVVIASVFITEPIFLREAIMLSAAYLSYRFTRKEIHINNHFNFLPIKEVAWLFIGIFITMTPALELLSHHSGEFGITSPSTFYWITGSLSSFLDNAPTYLTFLTASMGLYGMNINSIPDVIKFIAEHHSLVVSISISSVFFGAMTYIGNGPNFMVKSIADHRHIKTPGFFGYIFKYSIPILLPVYLLIWWLFIL